MRITAGNIKNLIGINKRGHLVPLSNQVLRKLKGPDIQKTMRKNSICIVCNYAFQYKTRGWSKRIRDICHPFKDTSIFPDNKKLHLLSESDFCDDLWIDNSGKYKRKYDYMIFTIDTTQGIKCKGYHTLPLICKIGEELGMKGLIIDYFGENRNVKRPSYKHEAKESMGHYVNKTRKRLRAFEKRGSLKIMHGFFGQPTLSKMIKRSGFAIFPNTKDASPRTIPEVLLRGIPVMVNKNIFGGWKYVNDTNGILFDGPAFYNDIYGDEEKQKYYYDEFRKSMKYMCDRKFNHKKIIKKYYSEYGFFHSARRLAHIINKIEGKARYLYVFYQGFDKILSRKWKRWHRAH